MVAARINTQCDYIYSGVHICHFRRVRVWVSYSRGFMCGIQGVSIVQGLWAACKKRVFPYLQGL